MTKHNVVTKSNELIDARYTLGLQSQKLILACLAKYDSRPQVAPTKSITITALEYSELMGINPKNAHRELYAAADALFKSSLILIEDGHEVELCWVQEKAKKITGDAAIKLIWSDRILRYISQLKTNFTSYKLTEVARFQSVYSIRIYEFLMRFKSTGYRVIEIEKLRKILGVEQKYLGYKSFSKDLLKPAINELNNNCDFLVTFERITKGRTTVALEFRFKKRAVIRRAEQQLELDIIRDEQSSHYEDCSLQNHL